MRAGHVAGQEGAGRWLMRISLLILLALFLLPPLCRAASEPLFLDKAYITTDTTWSGTVCCAVRTWCGAV